VEVSFVVVPVPGDVVAVDGRASVQFAGDRGLTFRVIAVSGVPTYQGWCWLAGYVLDADGAAVERREIYVQPAGLCLLTPSRRVPRQPTRERRAATTAPTRPRRAPAASTTARTEP
jgi:hypothetical protein